MRVPVGSAIGGCTVWAVAVRDPPPRIRTAEASDRWAGGEFSSSGRRRQAARRRLWSVSNAHDHNTRERATASTTISGSQARRSFDWHSRTSSRADVPRVGEMSQLAKSGSSHRTLTSTPTAARSAAASLLAVWLFFPRTGAQIGAADIPGPPFMFGNGHGRAGGRTACGPMFKSLPARPIVDVKITSTVPAPRTRCAAQTPRRGDPPES